MNESVLGFKPAENGQGAVRFQAQGIAEFTSRAGRQELALLLYNSIRYEIAVRKNEQRRKGWKIDRSYTAVNVMAGELDVTRRTIRRWKRGGFQSCNFNANKLVKLALHYAPEKTQDILQKELDRHWNEYYLAVADHENGQGAVRFQEAVAR